MSSKPRTSPLWVLTESDFVWVIVNDFGETFYHEVDQKIKAAYRQGHSNGTLFAGFSHNGIQYTIDFTSLRISQQSSSVTRLLQRRPPFWYRVAPETELFNRYEDQYSAVIEDAYRYGGSCVTMDKAPYMFIFSQNKSFQVDINTFNKIEIGRYPPVSSNPSEVRVKTLFQGEPRSVLTAVSFLYQSYYSRTFSFLFPVDGDTQYMALHQVANIAQCYCVSAQFELVSNQIAVALQGAKSYVEAVAALLHSFLQSELLKYVSPLVAELQQQYFVSMQEFVASSSTSSVHTQSTDIFPSWWEPQDEDCKLVPVEEGSPEWNGALKCLKETLLKAEIVRLERVQNRLLWEKYALEGRQMAKRYDEKVNERLLFHGSGDIDSELIVSSSAGVDFRYSSKDRKLLWGAGAYFAVKAEYSHSYAHRTPDKLRQLILAQVLTGKSCSCGSKKDSSLTKPPQLPEARPGVLYDTVNGETGGSTVYVTYSHDKSYPSYIITYNS